VCGSAAVIAFSTHGTLSSPGSPGRYPNNRDCFWTLLAPYNRRIQFHFFTMQIEASANCSNDYLEVCVLSVTNLIEFILFCCGTFSSKSLNSSSNTPMFIQKVAACFSHNWPSSGCHTIFKRRWNVIYINSSFWFYCVGSHKFTVITVIELQNCIGPLAVAAQLKGVGLQPLTCWDCSFESRWGHGCLSLVSVLCCQVEVSALGWSLVQRVPTMSWVWLWSFNNEEALAQ
jgi:hypothetical protein